MQQPENSTPESYSQSGYSRLAEDFRQERTGPSVQPATVEQWQQLVHDLQMRQAELEQENEELRQAKRESQQSDLCYRSMVANSPFGILLTDPLSGDILDANVEASRLLGYSQVELCTLNRTDILDTSSPQLNRALEQRSREGRFWGELVCRHADGTRFPVEIASSIYTDAAGRTWASVFFLDIRERKALEKQLRYREEKWRGLFELLPVGVSIVDPENGVSDSNPALTSILELSKEGIATGAYRNRKYYRSDHTLMPATEFPSIRAIDEGRTIRDVDIGIEKEDGAMIWTRVSATPLFDGRGSATVTVDITEQKRVEDALLTSEERLRAIIENTGDAIWSVDRDYRLLVANSRFHRSISAQLGRPLAMGESVLDKTFPAHANAFWRANYDRALAGEYFTLEMTSTFQRPGGMLEISLHPILGEDGEITGVVCLNHDITHRKQLENQLRQSEAKFAKAFAANPAGIALIRQEDGCHIEANDAYLQLTGYDRDEIIDHTVDELGILLAPYQTELAENIRAHGAIRAVDSQLVCKSYKKIDVLTSVETVDLNSERYYLVMAIDISERKQLERILRRINEELEQRVAERTAELSTALDELQRAARLKDEFMAAVSHELRTPLTGVLGMTDALELQVGGTLNERQLRYVSSIRQSGERLLGLVNNILRYTQLMAGRTEISLTPCNLIEICAICVRSARSHVEQFEKAIDVDVQSPELTIISDADALIQSIQQLLDNAIKFTPNGGRVGLTVCSQTDEDAVQITVWDTGIGITPEQQELIFQPFVQADGSLTRRFEGIGLGLAYVKRLIDLLGGSLTVKSIPGEGSRFTITLPAGIKNGIT